MKILHRIASDAKYFTAVAFVLANCNYAGNVNDSYGRYSIAGDFELGMTYKEFHERAKSCGFVYSNSEQLEYPFYNSFSIQVVDKEFLFFDDESGYFGDMVPVISVIPCHFLEGSKV